MDRQNNNVDQIFKDHRHRIDELDAQIVTALAERFKIVEEVGRIKAQRGIPVIQHQRAESVKQRAAKMAEEQGLDGRLVRHVYTLLIDHAHTMENELK